MRYVLSKAVPAFDRIVLVESGSRNLAERLLPILYENYPAMSADLVTCYTGAPASFREDRGTVFRVSDYRDSPSRKKFVRELVERRHSVVGIICSAEPIMTKWKWVLAARLPGKVFILNENCDYFWLDRGHVPQIRKFVAFRSGLTGAGAVRVIGRVAVFPFTLLFLMLYTATVHFRRMMRTL